jgi:hypothetical protein
MSQRSRVARGAIALAGTSLEPVTIEDCHLPATVSDQTPALQPTCCVTPLVADAEQGEEEFPGDRHSVRGRRSCAESNQMEVFDPKRVTPITNGRSCDETHQRVR